MFSSISVFNFWISIILFFSFFQFSLNFLKLFSSSIISFSSFWLLSSDFLSVSFFKLSNSILFWSNFLSIWSNSSGFESICNLILDAASSIKSIALSGKNLSLIYLCDNSTADMIAESRIFTPWCTSYFSFNPLRIDIEFLLDGSSTNICWNLLANAASFSILSLYSFNVVAPIQCNSPLARAGLRRFDASIAPSAFPAPTRLWISSIKSIMESWFWLISKSIDFNLSSNSPLNFAPATNAPKSREMSLLSLSESGTSLLIILWANPSTIAVFPTPGSPISIGLFLVLRHKTWILLLISSSLPITGSSFPVLARFVTSIENFFKLLFCMFVLLLSIVLPFLIFNIIFLNSTAFNSNFSIIFCILNGFKTIIVKSITSGEINLSLNSFLIFFDWSSIPINSSEKKILRFFPVTDGRILRLLDMFSLIS